MKILAICVFSVAIYNKEIHAKMSLNMEQFTFTKYNINPKEKNNGNVN
jgi:hypothetical protein